MAHLSRGEIAGVVRVHARIDVAGAISEPGPQHAAHVVESVGDEGAVRQREMGNQGARSARPSRAETVRVRERPSG